MKIGNLLKLLKRRGDLPMAYRYGDRSQSNPYGNTLEGFVSPGDSVRAYDAFVEALDFEELGIEINPHKIGNPEYDPKAMVKLLVYGYSYGFRSSRKLERAVYHNVSFFWLMGGLKPDHKTISEFRKQYKSALKKILKQCARLCIKLDLIDGNTLFVDGTKIRANASVKNTWTKEKCKASLEKIDQRIQAILSHCDATDEAEEAQASMVQMKKSLQDQETLKAKIQDTLNQLNAEDRKSINTIDPDCNRMNSIQGSHAGYNVQSVVDGKHGLIVHTEATRDNNDLNQFPRQIDQANETLEKKCKNACADSGYAHTDKVKEIDDQGIHVIVPTQKQASGKEPGPFDKERFQYDTENNGYICPEGHTLAYQRTDQTSNTKIYQIKDPKLCIQCPHFGTCTNSKGGRQITRLVNEETKQKLEAQYKTPEAQAIYKQRQQKVEHPFGHWKRNLKMDAFLLRGKEGAEAEASVLGACFNIARMITLLGGVPAFVQRVVG